MSYEFVTALLAMRLPFVSDRLHGAKPHAISLVGLAQV